MLCWGQGTIFTSITTFTLPVSYTNPHYKIFLNSTYDTQTIGNVVKSFENTGTKTTSSFQARTDVQHGTDWFTIGF